MHKQLTIWRLIQRSLLQNIPVMLLYVLESKGSSPGRQGFCMTVNRNGEMAGSIGGGIMEHKFVEVAKEKLSNSGIYDRVEIKKQIHDKSAAKNQSGMICSGEQTNLLYHMQADDLDPVLEIVKCLENKKTGFLQLSNQGLCFLENLVQDENFQFRFNAEQDWVYREKIGYKNSLHIIGGGHCSLALSGIMSMMDFYIYLYDTRDDLNTMTKNEEVHQKLVIDDYAALKEIIPSAKGQYFVVMTVGYRTDHVAVKALLSRQFEYFGLLGSSKKIKKLLSDLKKEGVSQEQLDKIYAPVGLPINSQTPEEIAISIAAQIIQVKNSRAKNTSDRSPLYKQVEL